MGTNGPVGCVALMEGNKLISAEKEGLFEYNLEKGRKSFIAQLETCEEMRYNDGKLDPKGRFIVGTKGLKKDIHGKGKLFSFDGTKEKILLEGLTISNGIGFTKGGDKMYFIDTPTKKVALYDYNLEDGTVSFDKFVVEIPGEGYPDGMCVDLDDMIWVAEWEGGKVCKWNPKNGEKVDEILLPCKRVTSCCLGGTNLDYLFITTAKYDKNIEPGAGGLFRVKIR
jgi:sugar lactone lactonase YvrE